MLPEDIAVREANYVSSEFHAQYSAREKEYIYALWTHPDYVLPQDRPFVWWVPALQLDLMQGAVPILQGRHDYAAFQNVGTPVAHTVRTIRCIELLAKENRVDCRFVANGFLKQMVRNMTAALVAVGTGRMSLEQLHALLEKKDRRIGPATAPARGLTLVQVLYDS
jgi:tRNA pseudouridine38-40 synthase